MQRKSERRSSTLESATEQRIGERGRRKTLLFNGYEEHVAHLYAGMDLAVYY